MKLFSLIFILYTSSIWAQPELELEQFADTAHGFSMMIPKEYSINNSSSHSYLVKEGDNVKFHILVQSTSRIDDDYFLAGFPQFKNLDLSDTLVSLAHIKCYYSLHASGVAGEAYGRVDSLIQWTTQNKLDVIELKRTQVIDLYEGAFEYNKAGPLFIFELNTIKDNYYVTFDLDSRIKDNDYESCKNIISSITTIQ